MALTLKHAQRVAIVCTFDTHCLRGERMMLYKPLTCCWHIVSASKVPFICSEMMTIVVGVNHVQSKEHQCCLMCLYISSNIVFCLFVPIKSRKPFKLQSSNLRSSHQIEMSQNTEPPIAPLQIFPQI